MFTVAQLGSYDRNIGDNIALQNIRHSLQDSKPESKEPISWLNLDISTFHNLNNSIEHSKNIFKDLQEKHNIDMLIIGGGGLIEEAKRYETGWKLPFNKEILDTIKVPIVVFSAGINYFYNYPELSENAKKQVIALYDSSSLFSLRNDGSYEIFKSFHNSDIIELPDPGLVFYHNEFNFKRKDKIKNGFFQPAWNNKSEQKKGREFTKDNLGKINEFCSKNDLDNFCHTPKDYSFPWSDKQYVIPENLFETACQHKNVLKTISFYGKYDFSVALRGHGQLIAVGVNLPSIYLSTQPKVLQFSQKNGFSQYTVDIKKDDWYQQLEEKTRLLKSDKDFLKQWYEIRDKNMVLYRRQMKDFCKKVWELL